MHYVHFLSIRAAKWEHEVPGETPSSPEAESRAMLHGLPLPRELRTQPLHTNYIWCLSFIKDRMDN